MFISRNGGDLARFIPSPNSLFQFNQNMLRAVETSVLGPLFFFAGIIGPGPKKQNSQRIRKDPQRINNISKHP